MDDHQLPALEAQTSHATTATAVDPDGKFDSDSIDLYSDDSLGKKSSRPDNTKPFDSLSREILFVGLLCVAQLTTQVGLGHLLILDSIIGEHYHIDNAGTLSWFISGFSLTVGSFILVAGRIGDHFGHKNIFIGGLLWYAVWSVLVGLSSYSKYYFFIVARVLQGIGPAFMLPTAVAILGTTYQPGLRKNLAFASFGAVAPGGAAVGAVFAALLKDNWPWAFYSLGLVLLAAAALSVYLIPDRERPSTNKLNFWQLLESLDILGGVVGVAALILFNFAWNQAPATSWKNPAVLVTLILGVLLVPVFFFVEIRVSSSPLLPWESITTDIGFVLGCIGSGWSSFGIWAYYLSQYYLRVRGASPLLTSAYFVPTAVSGAFAAITTGILLRYLRPAWVLTLSSSSFCVAAVLVVTIGVSGIYVSYWAQPFLSHIFLTWGMDMSFPAGTIIMSNAVKPEHQGVAASLIIT